MSTTKSKDFALFPGDFVNLGDAMLSLAAARRIAQDGGHCVLLPYRQPSEAMREEFEKEGFVVMSIRRHPLKSLLLCRNRSIGIGGGHAIRNEVSFGWLAFMFAASTLARWSGQKVRVLGAGASKIRVGWRKFFFSRILRRCDRIFLRDPQSAEMVSLVFPEIREKVEVAGDLAFLKDCLRFNSDRREKATCLISPGIDVLENRIDDPSELFSVLKSLDQEFGIDHIIVVPHDSRIECGGVFCQELAEMLKRNFPFTVELVSIDGIESGLLDPYSRARWIVTGRLHGLIIGALQAGDVIYTSGSKNKLQYFADLFGFKPAADFKVEHLLEAAQKRKKNPLLLQQQSANLNFKV